MLCVFSLQKKHCQIKEKTLTKDIKKKNKTLERFALMRTHRVLLCFRAHWKTNRCNEGVRVAGLRARLRGHPDPQGYRSHCKSCHTVLLFLNTSSLQHLSSPSLIKSVIYALAMHMYLCVPGWAVHKACVTNTNAANGTCIQSTHLWDYSPTGQEEKGEWIVSDACTVKNTLGYFPG